MYFVVDVLFKLCCMSYSLKDPSGERNEWDSLYENK